ncbi:unnamed protein product [Dovyalis caffra]|uniref:Ribosomal protein S18 n=1 Tax=Dovyalis caffra TaxID=77055 RepID=A0AAV1RFF4_9ROSI|nr:unnamed protein product [Dovyalis caffra]
MKKNFELSILDLTRYFCPKTQQRRARVAPSSIRNKILSVETQGKDKNFSRSCIFKS